MQFDQVLRRTTGGISRAAGWTGRKLRLTGQHLGVRGLLRVLGAIVGLILIYYVLGSILLSKVDANLNFSPPAADVQPGASRSVAMAAALLDREIDKNGWVPDDPIYKPTILQDNMPNFQKGLLQSLGRFNIELTDQLGRSRGSSQADPDLENASGLLRYPPDRWVWDPNESWWKFTQTAEEAFSQASDSLKAYNRRLAAGDATFDVRTDNLRATLNRIASDLGSTSATIDEFVATQSGFPWHNQVDDLFYRNKGQLYGYYMILKELGVDFDAVLKERNLGGIYDEMLASMAHAISLQPICVLNSHPDGQIFSNHLMGQGFYLLRARTQMREITDILRT